MAGVVIPQLVRRGLAASREQFSAFRQQGGGDDDTPPIPIISVGGMITILATVVAFVAVIAIVGSLMLRVLCMYVVS